MNVKEFTSACFWLQKIRWWDKTKKKENKDDRRKDSRKN